MSHSQERTMEALLIEQDWILSLAKGLSRDSAAAADLAQEAWLAALQNPPADASRLRGWLRTVMRRVARRGQMADQARRIREQRQEHPGEQLAACQALGRAEQLKLLVGALLELEEPFRGTLLMRFFDGLEPSEIARRQGIPPATVRSRLSRGLAKLREGLPSAEFEEYETGHWGLGWLAALGLGRKPRLVSVVQGASLVTALVAGGIWLVKTPSIDPAQTAITKSRSPSPASDAALDGPALLASAPATRQASRERAVLGGSQSSQTIQGNILASNGQPIGNATISLYAGSEQHLGTQQASESALVISLDSPSKARALEKLSSTISDEDGRFQFSGKDLDSWLERRDLRLSFKAPGFEGFRQRVVRGKENSLRPRYMLELAGVIRDAESGDAIQGVRIKRDHNSLIQLSDENGVFRFPLGRAQAEIVLTLQHPNYGLLRRLVDLEDPLAPPFELELERGRKICVQLFDRTTQQPIRDGRVFPGEYLTPVPADESSGQIELQWSQTERSEWAFVSPGYGYTSWSFRLEELAGMELIQIPLEPIATVSGKLLNVQGAPVADGILRPYRLQTRSGFSSPGVPGMLRFDLENPTDVATPFSAQEAHSDQSGNFVLQLLATDAPWNVTAWDARHHTRFEVHSMQSPLLLRMSATVREVTLRGRLERNGSAPASANTEPLRLGQWNAFSHWNEEGDFKFDRLKPGSYDLSLAGVVLQTVEVGASGKDIDLGKISLDSFVQLDLTLIDALGQAIGDEYFHARPITLNAGPYTPKTRGNRRRLIGIRTDAAGRARALMPGPGNYGLLLPGLGAWDPIVLQIDGDTKQEIQLPDQRTLHVRLLDRSSGKALPNRYQSRFLFYWRRHGEQRTRLVSTRQANAGCLALCLPRENIELMVRPWMWAKLPRSVTIAADFENEEQRPLVIELDSTPEFELRIESAPIAPGTGALTLWENQAGVNLTYHFVHESEFDLLRPQPSEQEAARLLGHGEMLSFVDQGLHIQQIQFDQTSSAARLSGMIPGRYRIIAVDRDGNTLPAPFDPEVFRYDEAMKSITLRRAKD